MEGSKAYPKHKRLFQFGRVACGFTERVIEQVLQEIAEGVSDARKEMVQYIEDNPQFERVGARMNEAWNNGVTRSLQSEKRTSFIDLGESKKPAPGMKGPGM